MTGRVEGAALLEVRGLTKSFGAITAVRDVDLVVGPGERVGLVGPNGAGKTTLFNCICGQTQADAGTVVFRGIDLGSKPTFERARLGIGRTFQRVEVFPELTVAEHLMVAERARRGDGRLWKDLLGRSALSAQESARVEAMLVLVGLDGLANVPVAALGLGTCRLVELARALIGEPVLLLADEPSSGLDAHETAELASVLRRVSGEHEMAVLLVEHDLGLVARVAERTVVMDVGGVIANGTFDAVMADQRVRHAYLGKSA